jgi:hypothetical protein
MYRSPYVVLQFVQKMGHQAHCSRKILDDQLFALMAPTGTFAISSLYAWDTSNLFTTGEITLTAIPEPANVLLAILGAAAGARRARRFSLLPAIDSDP